MLLSIILSTYDSDNTLGAAIDSVLNSKSYDFELIVIDDCPERPAKQLISSYKDSRLVYIKNDTNVGPGISRNRGIAEASGEFVTFIDADDWYEEFGIDYIISCITKNIDADLFVFDFNIIRNNEVKKKIWQESNEGIILDFLKDRLISTVWNKIYKKSNIINHDIKFPSYMSQDSVFNCKYLLYSNKMVKINKALYNFDKRGTSITKRQFSLQQLMEMTWATEAVGQILKEAGTRNRPKFMSAFERRRFLFLFREPLIRFYNDWEGGNIDRKCLEQFRKNPPLSKRSVLKSFMLKRVTFLETGVYGMFRMSPNATFIFMKYLGV